MTQNPKVLSYLKNTAKTVERVRIDYFPQPFKDYIQNVRSELHDIIKRTVEIYMWRCGIPGAHNPLFNGGMSFSIDGNKWNIIPPGIKVHTHAAAILQAPERISLSIKKLIKSDQDQPSGHQLYREAQFLRNTNPRISIVVAISALEVAVKECISKLNPSSHWLLENLPSPDVRKLINEYIPKLLFETTLGKVLPLPKFLNDTLRKGIQIRNQVAHLGSQAPSRESTDKILSAVQDTLWLLDFCSEHDWAIEYISKDTRDHIKTKIDLLEKR